MAHKIARSNPLIRGLVKSGVLPENCRRFVLDCEIDKPPKLFFECYGDERLLAILTASGIDAGERAAGERAEDPPPPPYREGFEL